ncbi:endo-1,4-beta-xylanase [Flindersiella endophytica]
MTPTRRFVVGAALLSSAAAVAPAAPAAASTRSGARTNDRAGTNDRSRTLGELGSRVGLRIGTAVNMTALEDDQTYREWVAREFSSLTAENVMKWGPLEPRRGEYDWAPADALVRFARANRQAVRGHTLLWHNQLPEWLVAGIADGTIGADELRQLLRKHIFDVAGHFRGKLYQWDVVNEVIDDNGNLRDTPFLRLLGPDYIADAFRWAHQADPKVKLYLNDYNVEGISAKSDAYYALVKQLLARRVPVQGFGAQGHLGVQYGFYPAEAVAENLRRFEALGLETSLTEVDVRMVLPNDTVKNQAQVQGYHTLMQGALLADRCRSFTVWGFTDKYSWVPGVFDGQGEACLLDVNFQPKAALGGIRADLMLAGGHR